MKRLWLLALALVALPASVCSQDICAKAQTVLGKLNSTHIQPRAINDTLSADIFSQFFRTLDPRAELFVQKDTGSLIQFRTKLVDGNEQACAFVAKATALYRKKIQWYRLFVDSVLSRPMDFSKIEAGPTVMDRSAGISKNPVELKSRVVKELKVQVLFSIYRQSASDTTIRDNGGAFAKIESAARLRVRKIELLKIERLLQDEKALSSLVSNSLLKAIPLVYDPHSAYFSKEEMDEFNERLNPSALSFGIKLRETATGEVRVASVVPGSPAWNSNQVNKDDVLTGIRWKDSKEYVDLSDLDQDMIERILDTQGSTSADLTIRKATGETREVTLVKESLENEDNIVSGFVLKGKGNKRTLGYISLPGFFTDINPELKGCAVAVTKEIIKLKGESIEGLILDLRYNGGGSLFEAMELAGLFIDAGPVAVAEARGEAPASLRDMNRGLIYDGPLVIMVNGASASASEVVAAALQDYKRAIVAGSKTFGKATGQQAFPVNASNANDGFLKVTQMRLYRVNGQSHQRQGVIPDFPIMDLSSLMFEREEQSPFALAPLTTNKKTYYTTWPISYADALKHSNGADSKQAMFESIEVMGNLFSSPIPLERTSFMKFMKKMENVSREMRRGAGDDVAYTVSNSKYDDVMLKMDRYHAEMNNEIISQVSSSVHIQEVYRLLDDILTKKK